MLQRGLAEAQHLVREFAKTIANGEDVGSPTRLPKLASGDDIIVFIVFAVALGAFNWGMRLLVIKPIVRRLLWPGHHQLKKRSSTFEEQKVDKFSQTAMEFLFYGVFAYFNCIVFSSQQWGWPSERWWINYDKVDPESGYSIHAFMTETVAAYFLLYGARYAQGMLSVLLEHRRKDFVEMQIHHFVVVALVSMAYSYGWVRIGMAIMVVQDPADVPLHIAKMLKYLGDARCPGNPKNFYQVRSRCIRYHCVFKHLLRYSYVRFTFRY
jgi:ceramide synthetase